jgi:selenocysteine lyase/cysteine desulfurase
VRELTARLRDGLDQIKGFDVLTPVPWEISSGITSLHLPGRSQHQVQVLIERIWDEFRTVVKYQREFGGIRISVASFNVPEEIDRLLEALSELTPKH